jgi:hypothetical protein
MPMLPPLQVVLPSPARHKLRIPREALRLALPLRPLPISTPLELGLHRLRPLQLLIAVILVALLSKLWLRSASSLPFSAKKWAAKWRVAC